MKNLVIIQFGGGSKCMFGAGILSYLAVRKLDLIAMISGSAIAISSAYFLAGQHQEYLSKLIVDGEYILSDKINIGNIFKANSGLVNIDEMIDHLKRQPLKLNAQNIINSKTDFIIPSMDTHSGKMHYISKNKMLNKSKKIDESIIFEMLRASVVYQFYIN